MFNNRWYRKRTRWILFHKILLIINLLAHIHLNLFLLKLKIKSCWIRKNRKTFNLLINYKMNLDTLILENRSRVMLLNLREKIWKKHVPLEDWNMKVKCKKSRIKKLMEITQKKLNKIVKIIKTFLNKNMSRIRWFYLNFFKNQIKLMKQYICNRISLHIKISLMILIIMSLIMNFFQMMQIIIKSKIYRMKIVILRIELAWFTDYFAKLFYLELMQKVKNLIIITVLFSNEIMDMSEKFSFRLSALNANGWVSNSYPNKRLVAN